MKWLCGEEKQVGVGSGVKRRSWVKKVGGVNAADKSVKVKTEECLLTLTTWTWLVA